MSVKGCLENLFERSHTFKERVKRHSRDGNEERRRRGDDGSRLEAIAPYLNLTVSLRVFHSGL